MRDGHSYLAPDSFRGGGEGGGGDGFSPWGSVGATEPPIYPVDLPTTSNCTKPIIPYPSTTSKPCLTMEHHGPTPWVFSTGEKQLDLHTLITIPRDLSFPLKMLIDSGSSGSLINKHLVEKLNIPKIKLPHPKLLVNADHSLNEHITHVVCLDLCIGPVKDTVIFAVANLGKAGTFLGFDWLEHRNPVIDWKRQRATFPNHTMDVPILDDGDKILWVNLEARATSLKSRGTSGDSPLSQVPEHLHDFADIFLKEGFNKLPPHREWDHAIKLVPAAKLRNCKVYPLSPSQQHELDTFIKENLTSQWICPSKSPLASPFFFIQKKDGSLCPVQDYHYLNSITIKNKYPLPLISDLIDKLKNATIFTKFDV